MDPDRRREILATLRPTAAAEAAAPAASEPSAPEPAASTVVAPTLGPAPVPKADQPGLSDSNRYRGREKEIVDRLVSEHMPEPESPSVAEGDSASGGIGDAGLDFALMRDDGDELFFASELLGTHPVPAMPPPPSGPAAMAAMGPTGTAHPPPAPTGDQNQDGPARYGCRVPMDSPARSHVGARLPWPLQGRPRGGKGIEGPPWPRLHFSAKGKQPVRRPDPAA